MDCVAQGARSQRRATTVAGAELTGRSVVIPALIAINVVIFVVTVMQARSLAEDAYTPLFLQWGLWPTVVAEGEWWRLFTSGFLHSSDFLGLGPAHLVFNMITVWVIGRDLEQVLGQTRLLLVYLVSLLGGSLAVFLFADENSLTVGASGAVLGLMGGLVVVLLRMRRSPRPVQAVILLTVVVSFVVPEISLLGHLGGLVFGAAVTAGLVYAPRDRRVTVQAVTVIALLAAIAVGVLARNLQLG
ncbi:MAG: rhomboid family intramembrane serine protease [Pseudonocardiaceae bacterium]